MLLTLNDLHQRRQPWGGTSEPGNRDRTTQFNWLVQQALLRLPIQPLLRAYPDLRAGLQQLRTLAPELFQRGVNFQPAMLLTVPLVVAEQRYLIEVEVNVGWRQGCPRLYVWGWRSAALLWSDQVRLWAMAEHVAVAKTEVQLVVIALASATQAARRQRYTWSEAQHEQVLTELQQLIDPTPQPQPLSCLEARLWDVAALPEVEVPG